MWDLSASRNWSSGKGIHVLYSWFCLLPESTPFSSLSRHLLAAQQDTLLAKALLSSWVWGTQEGVCVCRIYGPLFAIEDVSDLPLIHNPAVKTVRGRTSEDFLRRHSPEQDCRAWAAPGVRLSCRCSRGCSHLCPAVDGFTSFRATSLVQGIV